MLKQQMLIEKTNYEPHLNIELLTGAFIENQFKNICARTIYNAYINESLIIEYLKYRLAKDPQTFTDITFTIDLPFVQDYIEHIKKVNITCEDIPVITYVYNTLLREPGDRELWPHDEASLILDKIHCFFDIDENKLASELIEVISEIYYNSLF
jgi:hypothetical protein